MIGSDCSHIRGRLIPAKILARLCPVSLDQIAPAIACKDGERTAMTRKQNGRKRYWNEPADPNRNSEATDRRLRNAQSRMV